MEHRFDVDTYFLYLLRKYTMLQVTQTFQLDTKNRALERSSGITYMSTCLKESSNKLLLANLATLGMCIPFHLASCDELGLLINYHLLETFPTHRRGLQVVRFWARDFDKGGFNKSMLGRCSLKSKPFI